VLKAINRHKCKVSTIGPYSDLTYPQTHLGSNASILEQILDGSHPVAQELEKAALPMIVVGNDVLCRVDSEAVQAVCRKIAEKYGVISAEKRWNGYNVLQRHSGILNAL
jgi:NADH-quinone oxidoreductase subunit G